MRIITGLLVIQLSVGSSPAESQPMWRGAVRSAGAGPVTWVLVSGLIGGVSGFRSLEDTLRRAGSRVVTIDPYRLSIDSADVTYEALARRVDAVLCALGVRHARLVGHSNGAGVALRMAAFAPDRVDALYLLDAGALASNRGRVFGRSLSLVPVLARLPGGLGYIRRRMVEGVRENSGRSEWFDESAQRAYIEPMLDDIARVVSMAIRLGNSKERDPLSVIVARVRAPVTVLLGDAPHPSERGPAELDALTLLGARLEIVRLAAVGHFPHEEATAIVACHLTHSAARASDASIARAIVISTPCRLR